MENRKKKNLMATGIYIIVSFCFLILIGVGIFASLRAAFTPKPEIEVKLPENPLNEVKIKPDIPELPVIPENNEVFEPELIIDEPSVTETSEEPVVIENERYVLPMNGEMTKGFSNDTLVFSQTMKDYRVHKGVDFAGECGQSVLSFSDGVVEEFYDDPLSGMTMVVRHSDGVVSRYSNLSYELPENIGIGSNVYAGENIAFVGEPGILECAEGYHLHFEIEKNGQLVSLNDFEITE